jgi:hypothetical protein
MSHIQTNPSYGCFSWFSKSKQTRSLEEDDKNTRINSMAPVDPRSSPPATRSLSGNAENQARLSRESGHSRTSSSEAQKRVVSFSTSETTSRNFSNMSSLKAPGARKYPIMLDLHEDDSSAASAPSAPSSSRPPSAPSSSGDMIKASYSIGGSSTESTEAPDSSSEIKTIEGSAVHKLVEDAVFKLSSTIHSTLFPQPPRSPEPNYVLKSKGDTDDELYLM